LQPPCAPTPREEAQEVKAAAIAKTKVKITIVFLIFVVFKIETINCLVEELVPGNSKEGRIKEDQGPRAKINKRLGGGCSKG